MARRVQVFDRSRARTILLECPETLCSLCGGTLWSTTAQDQEVYDLGGPLLVLSKPRYCHNSSCGAYLKQIRPDAQRRRLVFSHRSYTVGVLAKLGALAYRQQRSCTEISQIMTAGGVPMSHQTAAYLLHLYDELVADDEATRARRLAMLREAPARGVVISFDGLQPDPEYPGLWLVRVPDLDLTLVADVVADHSGETLAGLLRQAKALVEEAGKTVTGVISDGEPCNLNAVELGLPGIPHQVCQFHFLRNLGKPILPEDSVLREGLKKKFAASS